MWSAGSIPPATRSIASLGRTYIFVPTSVTTATTAMKTRSVNSKDMKLDLDVDDFFHDQVADQLQEHRGAQHDVAGIVLEEELDVVRVGVEHQHRHRRRNRAQRRRRHASVSADGANAPTQFEALPNDVSELVQNFGQVAAGA